MCPVLENDRRLDAAARLFWWKFYRVSKPLGNVH